MHGAKETGDLAQASRSIADCEQRIRSLAARIEELRREGGEPVESKQVLAAMQDEVDAWYEHRRQVLSAMAETD
jgi:hypothetical protein